MSSLPSQFFFQSALQSQQNAQQSLQGILNRQQREIQFLMSQARQDRQLQQQRADRKRAQAKQKKEKKKAEKKAKKRQMTTMAIAIPTAIAGGAIAAGALAPEAAAAATAAEAGGEAAGALGPAAETSAAIEAAGGGAGGLAEVAGAPAVGSELVGGSLTPALAGAQETAQLASGLTPSQFVGGTVASSSNPFIGGAAGAAASAPTVNIAPEATRNAVSSGFGQSAPTTTLPSQPLQTTTSIAEPHFSGQLPVAQSPFGPVGPPPQAPPPVPGFSSTPVAANAPLSANSAAALNLPPGPLTLTPTPGTAPSLASSGLSPAARGGVLSGVLGGSGTLAGGRQPQQQQQPQLPQPLSRGRAALFGGALGGLGAISGQNLLGPFLSQQQALPFQNAQLGLQQQRLGLQGQQVDLQRQRNAALAQQADARNRIAQQQANTSAGTLGLNQEKFNVRNEISPTDQALIDQRNARAAKARATTPTATGQFLGGLRDLGVAGVGALGDIVSAFSKGGPKFSGGSTDARVTGARTPEELANLLKQTQGLVPPTEDRSRPIFTPEEFKVSQDALFARLANGRDIHERQAIIDNYFETEGSRLNSAQRSAVKNGLETKYQLFPRDKRKGTNFTFDFGGQGQVGQTKAPF